MAGLPTVQVLLDDTSGTGTWPYDITAYVELQYGYSITRGRSDEVGDVQPSTLGMTLNNTDGRFTLGTTGGGYGAIATDRRIQVKHTVSGVTTTRFTGFVQDWPVEWPGGGDAYAVAPITAVDRLSRLNRRVLRSIIEQEYLLDDPVAYYTLGEPAGSSSAADSSGNDATALRASGAVVFGTATGPGTDSLTAASIPANIGSALAPMLSCPLNLAVTDATVMAFIVMPTGNTGPALRLVRLLDGVDGMLAVEVTSLGVTALYSSPAAGEPALFDVGGNLIDGEVHHVAVVFTGGASATITAYVDGAQVGTDTGSATITPAIVGLQVGPNLVNTGTVASTVAHVAVYTHAVAAADITRLAQSGLNGFNADRSDQRVARYASYANIATADQTLETGVQTNVPHFDITGTSPTAAMQEVVNSEDGLLFLRGDGKLVFQNRTHRASQVTPDLTITADAMGPGDRFTGDMQRIINAATVTRSGGAGAYAENAASVAAHEQYPTSMDLKVATDDEARDRANWEASAYPEPLARLGGLTLDLLSQTVAIQQGAQALELSDRIQITGLPSQSPTGSTADLIVEGWTETVSATDWAMQFNASPWTPNAVWILGDSTYGVLGTTTRLSF